MSELQNLQREIEVLRKELDAETDNGLQTQECLRISERLNELIVEYMHISGRVP